MCGVSPISERVSVEVVTVSVAYFWTDCFFSFPLVCACWLAKRSCGSQGRLASAVRRYHFEDLAVCAIRDSKDPPLKRCFLLRDSRIGGHIPQCRVLRQRPASFGRTESMRFAGPFRVWSSTTIVLRSRGTTDDGLPSTPRSAIAEQESFDTWCQGCLRK